MSAIQLVSIIGGSSATFALEDPRVVVDARVGSRLASGGLIVTVIDIYRDAATVKVESTGDWVKLTVGAILREGQTWSDDQVIPPRPTEATMDLSVEPPVGSVVLTEGPHGTAWQRFASDGRWHSTTGKSTPWERLCRSDREGSRIVLAYSAPTR